LGNLSRRSRSAITCSDMQISWNASRENIHKSLPQVSQLPLSVLFIAEKSALLSLSLSLSFLLFRSFSLFFFDRVVKGKADGGGHLHFLRYDFKQRYSRLTRDKFAHRMIRQKSARALNLGSGADHEYCIDSESHSFTR